MKKATTIFAVLFICLSLAACSDDRKQAIEELNRNCDVPFALTLPEASLKNADGYVRNEGFGCYSLENEDISFTLGGYPDCL